MTGRCSGNIHSEGLIQYVYIRLSCAMIKHSNTLTPRGVLPEVHRRVGCIRQHGPMFVGSIRMCAEGLKYFSQSRTTLAVGTVQSTHDLAKPFPARLCLTNSQVHVCTAGCGGFCSTTGPRPGMKTSAEPVPVRLCLTTSEYMFEVGGLDGKEARRAPETIGDTCCSRGSSAVLQLPCRARTSCGSQESESSARRELGATDKGGASGAFVISIGEFQPAKRTCRPSSIFVVCQRDRYFVVAEQHCT